MLIILVMIICNISKDPIESVLYAFYLKRDISELRWTFFPLKNADYLGDNYL